MKKKNKLILLDTIGLIFVILALLFAIKDMAIPAIISIIIGGGLLFTAETESHKKEDKTK